VKITKNQNGFSLVEGLLAIIAIAIVGGVGYYVYHTQQEIKKTADAAKTTNQAPSNSTSDKKDYLILKEAGVKMDKSAIPGARYTVGKNQGPAVDISGFPDVMTFNLYDSDYEATTNSKSVRCGDLSSMNLFSTVQIVEESVRDAKYAQYKNKEISFDEAIPMVLSDKYATKANGYLYVYSQIDGVQGLPACAADENDQKVLDHMKQSQEGLKKMVNTIVKQ
jgi:hypothetical protein